MNTLSDPLAWQNLIFWISLLIGTLFLIGSAFGVMEFDADMDFDTDIEGDLGDFERGSPLDVGRVPFTMLVMMFTLTFGVAGIITNMFLSEILVPVIYGPISLVASFIVALVVSKKLARFIMRIMPTSETDGVSTKTFTGSSGLLITDTDSKSGLVNIEVLDRKGIKHVTRTLARSSSDLKKYERVVVVDFDPKTNVAQVEPLVPTMEESS